MERAEIDNELNEIGRGRNKMIIMGGSCQVVNRGGKLFAKSLYNKSSVAIRLHRATWFFGTGRDKNTPVKGSEEIDAAIQKMETEEGELWQRGGRHWRIDLPEGSDGVYVEWKDGALRLHTHLRSKKLYHGATVQLDSRDGAPTISNLALVIHGIVFARLSEPKNFHKQEVFEFEYVQ